MIRLIGLFLLLIPLLAQAGDEILETRLITLDSGRPLELVLSRPAEIDGPLPAVMLFGGFEGTARILDYIHSERPLIRASFNYPWDKPEQVSLRRVPAIIADFGRAVDDTLAGIDALSQWLRSHPQVDASRLMLVGASAGAPFATIGGARNRIPGVVIVQGFGQLASVIAHQFNLRLQPDYGIWIKPLSWVLAQLVVHGLDLPAPEQAARELKTDQQILFITAREDERIPAAASNALWQAILASDARASRHDLAGAHLRGFGDPAIDRIMALALDWMQRSDLLPPAQSSRD